MARRKKNEDNGLDVLEEIKEPFSFASFYENHIVTNVKKIKRMLDERGILFFFMSPFQQRNRLIIQLVLIIFGITLGIVPRGMSILNQVKERNANSEMAGLIEKDTVIPAGSINIKPIASSHYDKQHVLAFLITPISGGTIPSVADRYYVNLSAGRGVTDIENVKYSYDIIPFTTTDRILLVYIDNRKQNDFTGIYNLVVENREDERTIADKNPVEVILSDTQKTTELFDAEGIHLNSLSDILFGKNNEPISEARKNIETALNDYTLETERIGNQPVKMNTIPSTEVLRKFAKDNELFPTITDKSDTADILEMPELAPEEFDLALHYGGAIELNGVKYDAAYFEARDAELLTDDEKMIEEELANLQAAIDNVLAGISKLNGAEKARYDTLKNFKLIFNQPINPASFGNEKSASAVMGSMENEDTTAPTDEETVKEESSSEDGQPVTSEDTSSEVPSSEETTSEEQTSEVSPTSEEQTSEVSPTSEEQTSEEIIPSSEEVHEE